MDITEQIAAAWDAVEKSGVPEHLHEIAFKAALSLQGVALSSTTTALPAAPPQTNTARGPEPETSGRLPVVQESSDDFFGRFSRETGIDRDSLEEVFYLHEGLPGLNVPARKLGPSRSVQTRAVTLALTAAYHFGLDESGDRVAAVRKECERLKCYDLANFTRHLASAKGVNFAGPPKAKVLKTKPDAISELKELVASIRGTHD
ncbi:hypothetical protein [Arthrobacter sp. StoSoilB13]|uniref:hypothetical protein n=1 Tax=Arthrobacter sp. StoSoilB13 TaxID=2830993 RepID=UPI001CC6DF97|nr:hypothetical protein [Arthrobacter sp. StoSoilB13]BCW50095.1 hypothetical protein StoSoilB13_24370 [Arthrobacter sp. StoSoilB13]